LRCKINCRWVVGSRLTVNSDSGKEGTDCSKSGLRLRLESCTDYLLSRGHKCAGAGGLQRILTADLLNIAAWLKKNYLKINVKKTQLLLLGQKSRTRELDRLRIILDSVDVGQHDHVKYLGVAIDSQLTWKQHIKN